MDAVTGSQVASQQGLASPSQIHWPRFKVRRLLGFYAGEQGVGGTASRYPLGKMLGEGSYGRVYASSLGGVKLAVKVVVKKDRIAALMEASLAEQLAGHPHLVELKDVCVGPCGSSYLVYANAGVFWCTSQMAK